MSSALPEDAIRAWAAVVGDDHVCLGESELRSAQTATFATTQTVRAIVRPGNRDEVRECVRIAARHRVALYPVSRGKNWGYGSRVPVADGSVILSLERLDSILDFDERLAYITVEPGVSFASVHRFLRDRSSDLTLNSPGSTSDASVIGHALERGVVGGLNGDRCGEICALEVVLPDGGCLQTGMGRYAGARAAEVFSWGVGPSLDGLFSQSNLGIVTRLTTWLTPLPKFFQYFSFTISEPEKIGALIDGLQALKREGLIQTGCGLFNHYKVVTYCRQYPWAESEGRTPLPDELLPKLLEPLGGGVWFGETALTAADPAIGGIVRTIVKARLSGIVDQITFADPSADNPLVGPSFETGLASVYWRKRSLPPPVMNPDEDGCGVIWCVAVAPFTGEDVGRCLALMEACLRAFAFEPLLGVQCLTMRSAYVVASIVYDREQAEHDESAWKCEEQMLRELTREGFFPYRLGIRTMDALPPSTGDYTTFLRAIKQAVDSSGILAPGRYDFGHEG